MTDKLAVQSSCLYSISKEFWIKRWGKPTVMAHTARKNPKDN